MTDPTPRPHDAVRRALGELFNGFHALGGIHRLQTLGDALGVAYDHRPPTEALVEALFALTGDTPFLVYVQEGPHKLVQGRFPQLYGARRYALRRWDDALPHNHVYVVDERTQTVLGHAGPSGDGGADWYPRPR